MIVLYKLVLGSSKLLGGLLAVVIGLALYKGIAVLLRLNLFLIRLICPYNLVTLYIRKDVLGNVPKAE